jgi:predicted nucleic acid-binding protein
VCHPLTELNVIRHEPDNRFLECALAASAEFIVTVNTAPGHFDRKQYQTVAVVRPGEFLNLAAVGRLVERLIRG